MGTPGNKSRKKRNIYITLSIVFLACVILLIVFRNVVGDVVMSLYRYFVENKK
jgi:hypothetical protein